MLLTRMATRPGESADHLACGRRGCALALLVLLLGLAPLAHANPPDPTWIGGIYDDADYDDVVVTVTSAVGVVDEERPIAGSVELLAVKLPALDEPIRPSEPRLPSAGRAPPA